MIGRWLYKRRRKEQKYANQLVQPKGSKSHFIARLVLIRRANSKPAPKSNKLFERKKKRKIAPMNEIFRMKSIGDFGGDLSNGEIYLAINKVEGSGGQIACGDVSASDSLIFPPSKIVSTATIGR